MRKLLKPMSVLLTVVLVFSMFTIIPVVSASETVQVFAQKWVKADLEVGDYYSFSDLYQNFIVCRVQADGIVYKYDFDIEINKNGVYNRTGDLYYSGSNEVRLTGWGDDRLSYRWANNDSAAGDGKIYLSTNGDGTNFNTDNVTWYAYTWETFTAEHFDAAEATGDTPAHIEYYTAGERYFKRYYGETDGHQNVMQIAAEEIYDTPVSYTHIDEVEPYIDENGEYHLGTVEHYVSDGKNYAVNSDGSVGDELDSIELSYFEFELINSGSEYQVDYYNGPVENLSELVIPKTFNGKKITAVGNNNNDVFLTNNTPVFTLVLNENIEKINNKAFYVAKVSKVTGDTSSLNHLGRYAFSWANSTEGYTTEVHLDYPGAITCDSGAFNNMNITVYMKHSAQLVGNSTWYQTLTCIFNDEHLYSTPEWTWADDFSSASATLTCSDARCAHKETVNAEITKEETKDEFIYTATAVVDGVTYTDSKTEEKPAFVFDSIKADNAESITVDHATNTIDITASAGVDNVVIYTNQSDVIPGGTYKMASYMGNRVVYSSAAGTYKVCFVKNETVSVLGNITIDGETKQYTVNVHFDMTSAGFNFTSLRGTGFSSVTVDHQAQTINVIADASATEITLYKEQHPVIFGGALQMSSYLGNKVTLKSNIYTIYSNGKSEVPVKANITINGTTKEYLINTSFPALLPDFSFDTLSGTGFKNVSIDQEKQTITIDVISGRKNVQIPVDQSENIRNGQFFMSSYLGNKVTYNSTDRVYTISYRDTPTITVKANIFSNKEKREYTITLNFDVWGFDAVSADNVENINIDHDNKVITLDVAKGSNSILLYIDQVTGEGEPVQIWMKSYNGNDVKYNSGNRTYTITKRTQDSITVSTKITMLGETRYYDININFVS